MEQAKKNKIRKLGYRVRKKFDQISRKEGGSDSLEGYCARASAILSKLLDENHIDHDLVYGDCHVYIECDGYIVDTTSTQFSEKLGRVTVRSKEKMPKKNWWWWRTSRRFDSVEHLQRWQIGLRWPKEQKVVKKDFKYCGIREKEYIS